MSQRLVVLASGNGSTFEAIARACQQGLLPLEVVGLVTNNEQAYAIERAVRLGIPAVAVALKNKDELEQWDQSLCEAIDELGPDLIVLSGFLKKIGPITLKKYGGRILNTHPSLLPKFSGQGMYGRKVHEAVVSSQEKETGISVHIVTENYDEGPVLAQCKIEVSPDDTAESLEHKVKTKEPQFYIETIKKYIEEI